VTDTENTLALRRWALAFLSVALAVAICYFWLDRPIALFVHDQLPRNSRVLLEPITYIPNPLIWAATIVFLALGVRGLTGRTLSKMQTAIVLCSVSLMIAETLKNVLKFVFGRTWPETWVQNNPSFIHGGIYGFNLFHGGEAYQSFPSGHMTAICALASVLWIYYPRLRSICLIVALAVLVSLVGTNFHFLSDTIAGALVGTSTGLMVTMLIARHAFGTNSDHGQR
jgi:membrane-associated phospholipid phosphatase